MRWRNLARWNAQLRKENIIARNKDLEWLLGYEEEFPKL